MTECWVITDGTAGNENPARGLAEAVSVRTGNMKIFLKQVSPSGIWRRLPPMVWMMRKPARHGFPFTTLPAGQHLTPPWPDLVIGNGRISAPFTAAVRRLSNGRTLAVQLQAPRIGDRHFDLVVAPEHDHIVGINIMPVVGSLTALTPEIMAKAARDWELRFSSLSRPCIAVLIGGNSKAFRMTPNATARMCDNLERLANSGASLMVTMSRRTGGEMAAVITSRLLPLGAYIWDGTGDNPYAAILGLADAVVVTEDSVNMASEAACTGKPVFIAALDGGSAKMTRFHNGLKSRGITRPLSGDLMHWEYQPLRETDRAADEVCALLRTKKCRTRGPGKSNREV